MPDARERGRPGVPVRRRRGWEIPEREATSPALFESRPAGGIVGRRGVLRGLAAGALFAVAPGAAAAGWLRGGGEPAPDPSAELYPVARNGRYRADRAITDEEWVTSYNNFFEFSSGKRLEREARRLRLRPWTVRVDGLVEKALTIDVDSLLREMPLEERVYRHRCVEAWAMVVPWTGFPLASLLARARPLSAARFVRFETFLDPETALRQRQVWMPWPYTEGLTLAEATHELAFVVSGAYGKPLAPQNGAPLRLAVPWKYGFKSIKSIVRVSLTSERPGTFWNTLQKEEYGFWANVNPDVPHPRWSQATETMLGTREEVPTRIYNGYGDLVAGLYAGLGGEPLFL